jgi:hypothetical protein
MTSTVLEHALPNAISVDAQNLYSVGKSTLGKQLERQIIQSAAGEWLSATFRIAQDGEELVFDICLENPPEASWYSVAIQQDLQQGAWTSRYVSITASGTILASVNFQHSSITNLGDQWMMTLRINLTSLHRSTDGAYRLMVCLLRWTRSDMGYVDADPIVIVPLCLLMPGTTPI